MSETTVVSQHTPGPWRVAVAMDGVPCVQYARMTTEARNGGYVSAMCPGPDGEANARLIAAAPEMLETLRKLLWATEDWAKLGHESRRAYQNEARATIAKAEGR